jgi:AcrR family transcriptional regulator
MVRNSQAVVAPVGQNLWMSAPEPSEAPEVKRPRGRPRKLPLAAREELLLDTAAAAFAERGSGAVPVEAIAAAAGINKAHVYEHFATKDELLAAVIVRERDRLVAFIAARYEPTSEQPLRQRVRNRFHAFLDFAVEHPLGLQVLALPEAATALAAAGRGSAAADLTHYLSQELQNAGLPSQELPKVLAAMLVGMTNEVFQRSQGSSWDMEAVIDLLTDFTLAGLAGVDRAVFERADRPVDDPPDAG